VTKLVMKGSASLAKPTGRPSIKGDFVVLPGDHFDAPGGLTVRIKERLETDYQTTAPSCIVTGKGVSCDVKGATSTDPGLKIRLKNLPKSPASYKFAIKFNKRSEPTPFNEPVIVTLSEVSRGVDRVGQLQDCGAQRTGLRCRERRSVSVEAVRTRTRPPTVCRRLELRRCDGGRRRTVFGQRGERAQLVGSRDASMVGVLSPDQFSK
jgi:hypothetical protein